MKMLNSFEKKVLDTINEHSLIEKGDRILVGLSGGKDSAVLLSVLCKLSKILKFEVCAFHLNHMIRGDEALRDEKFSRQLCQDKDVEFYSESVNVPALCEKSGVGLEAFAREVRYAAFERCAYSVAATKIATAHTLSDNTETLMISLLRNGTLSPIPIQRGRIIRPLIGVSTEEVVEYAEKENIPFVVDSTNLENDYLRNYLRNDILPSLRSKHPGLDATLVKSGEIFSSYRMLAEKIGEKYFEDNPIPEKIDSLKNLAKDKAYDSVLFYVLSRILEKNGVVLTYERFEKISCELRKIQPAKSLSLSNGKELVFGYDTLRVDDIQNENVSYCFELKHGKNSISGTHWAVYLETLDEYAERTSNNQQKINKLTKNITICGSIINKVCYVRSRKEGDKYRCRGITRSVKKYFIDIKLDRKLRETFPIVCDDDGILWVPGLGIADRAIPDGGNVMSLSLEIQDF